MKKISMLVSVLFILSFVFAPFTVSATVELSVKIADSIANRDEEIKQEKIDEIFSQLNKLALDKAKLSFEECLAPMYSATSYDVQATINNIVTTKEKLDTELSSFGVKKLNPDSEEDMEILQELLFSSQNGTEKITSTVEDTPAEIAKQLSTVLSVYQYRGTRTVDGSEYTYAYIRVVDDKGYNLYTYSFSSVNMLDRAPRILSDFLSYNFKYGMSQLLAQIPGSWVLEWIPGNIFTILNSYSGNSSISKSGNTNIYTVTGMTITEMTYYFIYMPQYSQWSVIGSRASNIEVSITHCFKANIGGKIANDNYDENYSLNTGSVWYWYVDNFVRTKQATHNEIGYFTIECMNSSMQKVEPVYYRAPGGVLLPHS